jgi:hypothetical protein
MESGTTTAPNITSIYTSSNLLAGFDKPFHAIQNVNKLEIY